VIFSVLTLYTVESYSHVYPVFLLYMLWCVCNHQMQF